MHFEMSPAICFSLYKSNFFSSGNGLNGLNSTERERERERERECPRSGPRSFRARSSSARQAAVLLHYGIGFIGLNSIPVQC